jgi:hypothetical protein
MVEQARELRIDLFVCPGDIYERASTPKERAAVAAWIVAMAAVCPVIITKGNHDRKLDCALLAQLRSAHPIYVEEAASVQYVAGAAIACVAWPERASVLAASNSTSAEGADLTAQSAMRAVLAGLGHQLAEHKGPRILAGHFMVDGSVTSVGQPLVGQSMTVGLSDLALANADIALLSHIHCPQDWQFNGAPIVYCGSPFRTTYGELEAKSVVVVEFGADGRLANWRRIETPCAPMVLVPALYSVPTGALLYDSMDLTGPCSRGAEVRIRYDVPADHRDAARASAAILCAELLELGAVDVKLEERVIATGTARAPEVARATTLPDKLRALWAARGNAPEVAREEALLARAHELETEESAS